MAKNNDPKFSAEPPRSPQDPTRGYDSALALNVLYETEFPVLQRALSLTLLRRAYAEASAENPDPESVNLWHRALIENAKLAQPAPVQAQATGEGLMNAIWDIFGIPAEERAKRRAAVVGAAKCLVAASVLALTVGCVDFRATQSFYDPEVKAMVTNQFHGTFVLSKTTAEKLDVAKRTKTTSALVSARGADNSTDAESVGALIGAAVRAAAK